MKRPGMMPGLVGSVQDVLGEMGPLRVASGSRLALAGDNVAVVHRGRGGGGVEGDRHAGCDLLVGRGAWDGTMYLSPRIMVVSGLPKCWIRWWRLSGSRTVGGGRRGRSAGGRFLVFLLIHCTKPPFWFACSLSPVTPRKLRLRDPLHRRRIRLLSGVAPASQASNSSWALACPRASPRASPAAISGFRIFSNMYMTIFSPT